MIKGFYFYCIKYKDLRMSALEYKMPVGTNYLHWINALTTFSYAVLFSSLALYLTRKLNFSFEESNSIVGLFLAINFALHLLSGYIGGKLISNRLLFISSLLFQIIGIYLLAVSNAKIIFFGLSFFLIGCGFNSTCLNCMLTQQFEPEDDRRETAFFINYWAMNIGFFMGFLVSGFFDLLDDYKSLFYLSNLTNLIILFLLIFAWKYIGGKEIPLITINTNKKALNKYSVIAYMILFSLIPIILIGFKQATIANNIVLLIGFSALILIFIFSIQNKNIVEKNKIYAYLILTIFSIVFWMLFYVGPMGVAHFLKNNVDVSLFNYKMPPQWLMNLNSIFVILGSPVLAYIFSKLRNQGLIVSISKQFVLSLVTIALSFYFLSVGIFCANSSGFTSSVWIIMHFLAQAVGELLIAPIGYAMIGKLAPSNLQGIMMGTWMMVAGISASLSHYFSNIMTKSEAINPLVTNDNYFDTFNTLGFCSLISAGLLFFISSKLDEWTNEKSSHSRIEISCT